MAKKLVGNGNVPYEHFQREAVKRVQGADLEDRALGQGSTRPGTAVGKQNAVWAEVDLTGLSSLDDVRVSHSLGVTPTVCELVEVRNSAGKQFATAIPILKNRWNATTCRVAVHLIAGPGQAGTVLKFRVGGE